MPQRAMSIILAVLGLGTVLGLVVFGVNLRLAAKTGPRWRRRLVAAGLVVLATLGIASGQGCNRTVTCYVPALTEEQRRPALARLTEQLAALEKHETEGTLDREVLRVAVNDLSARVEALDEKSAIGQYPEDQRDEAKRLLADVRKRTFNLRWRVMGGPLPRPEGS